MIKAINKKISMFIAIVNVFFIFSGCTNVKSNSKLGRYVEEVYNLEEKVYFDNIIKLSNYEIGAVGYSCEKGYTSFISEDDGRSWKEQPLILPEVDGKEVLASNIQFLSLEKRLVSYYIDEEVNDNEKIQQYFFAIADDKGNCENIDINIDEYNQNSKNYLETPIFKISDIGDVFFQVGDEKNKIIQFDGNTFIKKNEFEIEEYAKDFILMDDKLIVFGWEEICEYNTITGELTGRLNKLEEATIGNNKISDYEFIDSGSNEKIYYYSNIGVFSYDIKDKNIDMIIDGTISIFGDSNMFLKAFIETEDEEFLGVFSDIALGGSTLISFAYNADIPSIPSNELVVYSLVENEAIRSAISKYSKLNTDIYIKYEVGLSDDLAITELDAIKTLNSEIVAGRGPDILILDNLSIDNYIESGLLEDISDVINPLVKSENIFSNIVEAYTNESKIYTIPLNFKFPILIGEESKISSVKDLQSFSELISNLASDNEKRIFTEYFYGKYLVYALYSLCGEDWIDDNSTVNEKELKEFLEYAKKIGTAIELNQESILLKLALGNEYSYSESISENIDEFDYSSDEDVYYTENIKISDLLNYIIPTIQINDFILYDEVVLGYGGIDGINGYLDLVTAIVKGNNMNYKVLNNDDEQVFIPMNMIGINSKSKNKDMAKQLLESLLKDTNQYIPNGQGFSINKKNIITELNSYIDNNEDELEVDEESGYYISGKISTVLINGVEKEVNTIYPKQEEIDRLINEIESLSSPVEINTIVLQEVAEYYEAYFKNEISLDDAVKSIEDSLQLYLME